MAYLALDLGASSGRAIVGTITDGKIQLDEVHRFDNTPVKLGNTLYWDFLSLFQNIKEGIRLSTAKGYILRGIGVDTWGVDFGLIDKSGKLLSNPVCYRDLRTKGLSIDITKDISKSDLYAIAGIQQMDINTIFQLLSLQKSNDPTLLAADKLLFTPDLVNYFLTGIACNEYTIASTSQLLNAQTREWDRDLFQQLGLPYHLMSNIVHPGTVIGKLTKELAEYTGATEAKVLAIGSHDTASAIAAIPFSGKHSAFLSSGTWSLLGILSDQPVLTKEAMLNEFTNEGGVNNQILFMRNITGLWLLQRLIDEWEKDGKDSSYNHILLESVKAPAFQSIVNSDDASFVHPASMTQAIQDYCKQTGQAIPCTQGELTRCVLESLAIKYYFVVDKLETCIGQKIKHLFVVGGGSQNELLNQYIADALHLEVVVGLTESTAIGNIMQQAIADNSIKNIVAAHSIIKNSFPLKSYYPQSKEVWEEHVKKIAHLFN